MLIKASWRNKDNAGGAGHDKGDCWDVEIRDVRIDYLQSDKDGHTTEAIRISPFAPYSTVPGTACQVRDVKICNVDIVSENPKITCAVMFNGTTNSLIKNVQISNVRAWISGASSFCGSYYPYTKGVFDLIKILPGNGTVTNITFTDCILTSAKKLSLASFDWPPGSSDINWKNIVLNGKSYTGHYSDGDYTVSTKTDPAEDNNRAATSK